MHVCRMNNTKEFWQESLSNYERKLKEASAKLNQISTLRLVIFVFLLVSLYASFSFNYWLVFLLIALVIVFGVLVKKHQVFKKNKNRAEWAVQFVQNELKALDGDFTAYKGGARFKDSRHPYALDLDLFGEYSLFKRVNRCSLPQSERFLADLFLQLPTSEKEIIKRQEIFKELADNTDWRVDLAVSGCLSKQITDADDLEKWLQRDEIIPKTAWFNIILKALPLITIGFVGLWLFGLLSSSYAIALGLVNLVFTGVFVKKINLFHNGIAKKRRGFERYAHLLAQINQGNFKHEELISKKNDSKGGDYAIHKLFGYFQLFDARLNMLMGVVLNALLLWDLNLMKNIEDWKRDYLPKLSLWVDTIAYFEAYASMANYVFNQKGIFPNIDIDADYLIKSKDLKHPLMLGDNVVSNNFEIAKNGQLILLSGANMSGKSTYLRTVGLNAVIAQSGLSLKASSYIFMPAAIFTSMRISDSLGDNESYFYAELKRLSYVVEQVAKEDLKLVLLDEILRGTNSNDKHKGSVGLIKKLLNLNASGIIASHDIALASLANEYPDKVINNCFEVENKNGSLVFDYKLRPGVCKNLNATYLMEKMGVI